jgi:hypothetical protein
MHFGEGIKEPEQLAGTVTSLWLARKTQEVTNLNEIRKTDWTCHLVWICDCSNLHPVAEYPEKQNHEEGIEKAE